ncbi:hypothetical protein HDU85_004925 [Gaertneriomyces sp. JEL0708]|nr:hypothetical protein HDU85_004925 [Gaertneriomyces sp. JEL0708]
MARPAEYTVIATVLEGRHFLRKPNSKLYVQCRFNEEILTSDPVDHVAAPLFDTELAWDIDSKALSFLKSQRATLKIQIYSISPNNKRDNIGYVVLELRSAGDIEVETWHPLLNAKYSGVDRPEINIAFVVQKKVDEETAFEQDAELSIMSVRSHRSATARQAQRAVEQPASRPRSPKEKEEYTRPLPADHGFQPSKLRREFSVPVELTKAGYYQLGVGTKCWLLQITLAFAEHLNLLADPRQQGCQYHFLFNFLNNVIKTEEFANFDPDEFPAERVSIRIRSSEQDLRTLIEELSTLVIQFCRDDGTVLGFTEISLRSLLSRDAMKVGGGPFPKVDKNCNIFSADQELPMSVKGDIPTLGLSLAVTDHDNDFATDTAAPRSINESATDDHYEQSSFFIEKPPPEQRAQSVPPRPASPPVPALQSRSPSPRRSAQPLTQTHESNHATTKDESIAPWHQYRFSVDLRSVRDFTLKSTNIFLKYAYPAFGTSSPVFSHPPLSVSRNATSHEILLPHSFCAFEFVMAPARLKTYLEAVPLVVEMWARDPFRRDYKLGSATVNLGDVWNMPKFEEEVAVGRSVHDGKKATIQSMDQFVAVIADDDERKRVEKISDLRIVIALEDFGGVSEIERYSETERPPQVHGSEPEPMASILDGLTPTVPPELTTPVGSNHSGSTPMGEAAGYGAPEYKVALELELWRAEEERKFRAHLRARENELLERLASEWKQAQRQRENTIRSRLDSVKELEHKIQSLAEDLENRERAVKAAEIDMQKRQMEMERDMQRAVDEARDASRRVHDEYSHKLQLSQTRIDEAERSREEFVRQNQSLQLQVEKLQKQFAEQPETGIALRTQIADLERHLASSNGKLEKEKNAKKYYKTQWVKALKEIARYKKETEARLLDEVERLRNGHKDSAVGLELLDTIRKELDELKQSQRSNVLVPAGKNGVSPPRPKTPHQHDASARENYENLSPHTLNEVERLARERDSLLSSGVYTREDRLVRELDRRIRELLSNSG